MKRLPIGISDYKEIIENNYSCIDKTLFIKEIIEANGKVLLIPRPRRFGKTTNLSMLRYFFDIAEKNSSHLFEPFAIWETDHKNSLGQFPVISLTLKGMEDSTWDSCYGRLALCMAEEFERYKFLLKIKSPNGEEFLLGDSEREQFQALLLRKGSQIDLSASLRLLISWLYRYYNKRVVVLIDEYDAPIQAAYLHGYYDKMTEFMRGFLGGALKDNSLLEKAVLTGILRVSKESIFSGFNNVNCYTILRNQFGDKFGLLEEEVSLLFKEHAVPFNLKDIRDWYNGYFIGGHCLYNPWSILQCIDNQGRLQPYWINTSDNKLIKRLLLKGAVSLQQDAEVLLSGGYLRKSIEEGLIFTDLEKQSKTIWSLFFFSGYLTLAKNQDLHGDEYNLKIPNEEVKKLYKAIVRDWLVDHLPESSLPKLLDCLVTGNIKDFSLLFQTLIWNAMSTHDLPYDSSERTYHVFVLGLLVALEGTHEVKSNRESGVGRYDVCLIPKDPSALGIVIEFKKIRDKESLEDAAEDALLQIQKKNYAAELHSRNIKKVLALGCVFQGKTVLIRDKALL